jgi:hypothetical protein
MKGVLYIFGLACLVSFSGARAESYHVILCGSGGEQEFCEKFYDWGTRLEKAIVSRLDVEGSNVFLLTEAQDGDADALVTTSLETIQTVLEIVQEKSTVEDEVYVYFIGHGSYFNSIPRFHIPGPDLTAELFGGLIEDIEARYLVIVNGASSSAAFINTLSGPKRIICTATKSATEYNATEFMGFWVEALEDGSADRDRDERISVYELCQQAAELTDAWYIGNGYISTEHALLDDNGDGLGTRLSWDMVAGFDPNDPKNAERDGALARSCYLKSYSFPEGVPQEWIDDYLKALDGVSALKKRKHELESEAYYGELERLFLDAARANQKIRAEGREDEPST